MKTLTYNKATIVVSFFAFLIFFSGIIRDDVKEEKYLQFAHQKQFDCVGQVYKDSSASGSCVLISDHYVLSAAHVFIEYDTRQDTITVNKMTVTTFVPYNQRVTDVTKLYLVFNGQKIKAKKIILH